MFWTLPLIAMRQEHHEPTHSTPLDLPRRNKLIYYHLRTVGKVSKLPLPYDQRIRLSASVAIFKCQNGLFRENGINHTKVCLIWRNVLQGDVVALIPLHTILIM